MGIVISNLVRPFKNYNALGRAHKYLEKNPVRPAPKHPTDAASKKQTVENRDVYTHEHHQLDKNDKLLENLKNIYVTSRDAPLKTSATRTISNDKGGEVSTLEPLMSEEIHPGRVTLSQAVAFIAEYQAQPQQTTLTNISNTYNININLINKTVEYFGILQVNKMPADMSSTKLPEISALTDSSKRPPR